jgi:hypothetical protein
MIIIRGNAVWLRLPNGAETQATPEQCAAEIERLRAEREWQPIETAPKDEMFIYYWPRRGKRAIGLAYLAKDGRWRDSEMDWEKRIDPTHWMPLPAPPEDK